MGTTIFEEKQELMISPTGDSNPILRTTHFLKPILTSVDESSSLKFQWSYFSNFEDEKLHLDVVFSGWRRPQRKWKSWVDQLHSKHEATWRKAGIYEAILNSTFDIRRDNNLILALAEKWCPETNTFVFPWGETTISLEDMLVLGGFPVLGESVVYPFEAEKMVFLEECLSGTQENTKQNEWLNEFYECGSEFEHESFLILWLSRFVFPGRFDMIRQCVYPIVVCLARGIKVALAPAVLASIYRDLNLMKAKIVASSKLSLEKDQEQNTVFALNVGAPFQLVQVWIWERFVELRPMPNLLQLGEPRFAKWDRLKKPNINYTRMLLNSSAKSFQWRLYNSALKAYTDRERSILVDSCLDEEVLSYARCIRVSELVGLGCIEQYLPHRVSMQFGIDQDLPGHVARSNESVEIAWGNYIRPIDDVKLYIPAKLYESDVTTRYLEWWKHLLFDRKDVIRDVFRKKRSSKRWTSLNNLLLKKSSEEVKVDVIINTTVSEDILPPPGFPHKYKRVEEVEIFCTDKVIIQAETPTNIANEQVDKSKSKSLSGDHSVCPFNVSRRVVVQDDETDITKSEGEVDGGNPSNAAGYGCIDEINIRELESRINKLEKVFSETKSVKSI